MNEIPKNVTGLPQPQKVEQVKVETAQETAPAAEQEVQAKEIKEIPENPADRSGVKVDNLENDIKVFAQNPELAAKALEVAELAEKKYQTAGIAEAELKALAVGKAFVDEFQK